MASSSCLRFICDNIKCRKVMLVPRPGWLCEDGHIAELCDHCFVAYMRRQFCEVHHEDFTGWKPCRVCKMNIHCGCVAIRTPYVKIENEEIECCDCNGSDDVETQNQCFETVPDDSPDPDAVSGPVASTHAKPKRKRSRKSGLILHYRPMLMEQEINHVYEASHVKITALFDKVLTSSDTGRMGRLVIPKKYAEAYFPSIDEPEGEPVVIEDPTGKDWEFTFRFWPNNNSRMYVLEGFHLCVKALKLQVGDTVTFNRLEPEGKLILGYDKAKDAYPSSENVRIASPSTRKKSKKSVVTSPSRPKTITASASRLKTITASPSRQKGKMAKATSTGNGVSKDKGKSPRISMSTQEMPDDSTIVHEVQTQAVPFVRHKKKRLDIGSGDKNTGHQKRVRKRRLSFEGGQELSPPLHGGTAPPVDTLSGGDKNKDAPAAIARPSIFAQIAGGTLQWAQCNDCFKWRKVPADARIPSGWTCPQNYWDQRRSRCSAKEEQSLEQINNTYLKDSTQSTTNETNNINLDHVLAPEESPKKKKKTRRSGPKPVEKVVEQNAVAVMPVENEGPNLLETPPRVITTKHPRHRSGCFCIVCIQPPSGSKHKPSCDCYNCMRRRLQAHHRSKAQNIPKPPETNEVKKRKKRDGGKTSDPTENVTRSVEVRNNSNQQMVNGMSEGKKRSRNNDPNYDPNSTLQVKKIKKPTALGSSSSKHEEMVVNGGSKAKKLPKIANSDATPKPKRNVMKKLGTGSTSKTSDQPIVDDGGSEAKKRAKTAHSDATPKPKRNMKKLGTGSASKTSDQMIVNNGESEGKTRTKSGHSGATLKPKRNMKKLGTGSTSKTSDQPIVDNVGSDVKKRKKIIHHRKRTREENIGNQPMIEGSNRNEQVIVDGGDTEDGQNRTRPSGSEMKSERVIDLNLPPEPDEDSPETME